MEFRLASKNDISSIADLHVRSWQLNYRDSLLEDYLDHAIHKDRLDIWTERLLKPSETQHVLLAEDQGRLLGFVCTFLDYHKDWGAYLDNLHVQPDLYGRGIGAELLRKSAAYVSANRPKSQLYLWVLEKNKSGIRFYERMGGVNEGISKFENPGGGTSNAFRIAWEKPSELN